MFGGLIAPSISKKPRIGSSVIIGGEIERASGLGEGARIMHRALEKHQVQSFLLNIIPYNFSLKRYKLALRLLSDNLYSPLILHVNSPQIPFALLALPAKLLKDRYIIGYWAWELESLPKDWQVGFKFVHEIWVPSQFVANAVKPWASKYNKTVRVVPHPIADGIDYDTLSSFNRATFNLPENKVVVLVSFNLSSSYARKNPLASITAFLKAYEYNNNLFLLLKICYTQYYPSEMNEIMALTRNNSNILIHTEILSDELNKALFREVDIVLSLHRSEGFGLVPAEAMLCGKPVISTNWSATTEYIDKQCGVPVPYELISVEDERHTYMLPNAVWAEADCVFAANSIYKLSTNEGLRNTLGSHARIKALEQFNSKQLLNGLSAIGITKSL